MRVLPHAVRLPPACVHDRTLCYYWADETDSWSGYLVAKLGWNGRRPLPSLPAPGPHVAMLNWQAGERIFKTP